jgi:hypothetical protein
MFMKIVTVGFYFCLALFFFHVRFTYLEIIIAGCAVIIGINQLRS